MKKKQSRIDLVCAAAHAAIDALYDEKPKKGRTIPVDEYIAVHPVRLPKKVRER